MTAKVHVLDIPGAMARILHARVEDIHRSPENGECYLCQHKKDECVCADPRFQAARAIAFGEGRSEELKAIMRAISGTLIELQSDPDFDPFEDAIDEWHERDGLDHHGEPVQLHAWLGLTQCEFAMYATCAELTPLLYMAARLRSKAHREEIDTGDVSSTILRRRQKGEMP